MTELYYFQPENKAEKQRIAREILEDLPEWFEVAETREQYIRDSADRPMFAAVEGDRAIGFLCLKQTGKETVEVAVMGVRKEGHRRGIGTRLFEMAREAARQAGYSFLQVKTVAMGYYPDYDETNLFYRHLGFKEFEVIPAVWDELNPCQIYVMAL